MVTANHIREYLQASPFRPFRVYLNNGSYHDIPAPEIAQVLGTRLFLRDPASTPETKLDGARTLPIPDMTHIEPIAKRKGRK